MASHRLRAGLTFCLIGERAIFLDRGASRYFLLEGPGAENLEAFVKGRASEEAISSLTGMGLVELGNPSPEPAHAPPPIASLHDRRLGTPQPWLLAEAMFSQARSRRLLTRHSLGSLLQSQGAYDLEADLDRCRPIAAAIDRVSRYRDATDQCLVRGLAMRAMLARRGLSAELVIGVMLPFAAHCWIQSGTTVLSDPLDRVANFTPLLTVR